MPIPIEPEVRSILTADREMQINQAYGAWHGGIGGIAMAVRD